MKIANNYQYTLTDRRGTIVVAPLGENDFLLEWSQENDGKQYYKQEMPSKITFTGEPFTRLLKMEKSRYRCDYIGITIDRKCNGGFTPFFSGRFSLNDGEWNISGCEVSIKMDDVNIFSCYEDNKSEEVNLFSSVYQRRTIALYDPRVTIETLTQTFNSEGNPGEMDCGNYAWEDPNTGYYDFAWQPFYSRSEQSDFSPPSFPGDPGRQYCNTQTQYARQVVTRLCGEPSPGPSWLLINDCYTSGGVDYPAKYARPASVYNCKYTNTGGNWNYSTMECSVVGVTGSTANIDNGIALSDVLNYFVSVFCTGLTVKSDFFQINPYTASDINYVTGQRSKTKYITMFQKSDVKRPTSTGNATIAKYTFEKLLNALVIMFNVRWRIEGGVFRIEHVSGFQPGVGMDLTLPRYSKWVKGKERYSYENSSKPKREEFTFMEASYGDFQGLPIEYNTSCVTKTGRDNVKKYAAENITTDVQMVISNPEADSKVVSDDGFVFMAADIYNGAYFLISEESVLGYGGSLNNSLAWAQLHRDYHRHERYFRNGKMNGIDTRFLTVIPTKKGDTIVVPLCCSDGFDPNKNVITALGSGRVDKAKYSFKANTLSLDLMYVDDDGLTTNAPPVAQNDVKNIYLNQTVDIDILANDADPEGIIERVEIYYPPSHGTAVVLANKKIRYVPTGGFVGQDFFGYRIYDDWSEPSNNASVSITVLPANAGPVPGAPTFQATINTPLSIAAPGALAGSSDDVGFVLDSYDNISANNAAVTMNPDGSFVYATPNGFIGNDTFKFKIKDDQGLTAIGTVTIVVRNPNFPVANDDNYATSLNANLTVPAPGLLANDSGPGPISCTPQTKSTTLGGSVVISANGAISYTPPAHTTGKDTFTYTANNSSGSATAKVTISIIPKIYVRLSQTDTKYDSILGNCNGSISYLGDKTTADFILEFFSSSNGVTKVDVTGLGLMVNIRILTRYSYPGNQEYDNVWSVEASGESVQVFDDRIIEYASMGCGGGGGDPAESYRIDHYLVAGNYTII